MPNKGGVRSVTAQRYGVGNLHILTGYEPRLSQSKVNIKDRVLHRRAVCGTVFKGYSLRTCKSCSENNAKGVSCSTLAGSLRARCCFDRWHVLTPHSTVGICSQSLGVGQHEQVPPPPNIWNAMTKVACTVTKKRSERSCRILATYRAIFEHSADDLPASLPIMLNSLCFSGR